ncbi:UNVERIFIED_CONTAM: anaphase-promoting complex subunit Hcn1 [Siphonaria sp. JEL0065]|nr:anaphase-promoting complex subunit Hcn1 [Siphonaria sp. JEL0065]
MASPKIIIHEPFISQTIASECEIKDTSNTTLTDIRTEQSPVEINRYPLRALLYDLFSYYFLIPAFDCRGRKIPWDQFDQSDFDDMSFTVNGIHPKSRFMTGFDILIICFGPTYTRFLFVLRLIRVYRLPSIAYRCALYTRIKTHLEGCLGVGGAKIVPIAIAIFIYMHFNACMIYFSGQLRGFEGWSQLWMKMEGANFWESYVWVFMLAVGNIFPIAFKPQSIGEQLMAIIFIFVGAGLYAVLVGYISSAAMSIDNSGRVYNQKMEELVDYIKWKKLNNETREKLIQYYQTKYRGKYFEEDELLNDMNEALRTEISLQNTRELITKVPFLCRHELDNRNEIFYSRIASVLHARYFIPGDCVTKQGESGTDMFFVLSGKLAVMIDGERKISLYDGAYFGEVALITKALRTATVQAKMPSVLYRLTIDDFQSVLDEFPDMQFRISQLALEREKILRLTEERSYI